MINHRLKPLKDKNNCFIKFWTGPSANFATGSLQITIKDSGGKVVNISGWSLQLCCKEDVDDTDGTSDPNIFDAVSGTIPVGTDGIVNFDLTSVNISASSYAGINAILVLYRLVSANKRPICQWRVPIVESAVD